MNNSRRSRRSRLPVAPLLLGTVAVAAGGAFALLARAAANRKTLDADVDVHRTVTPPRDHPLRTAGKVLGPMGKWYAYIPAAVGVAGRLLAAGDEPRRGRRKHRRNRRAGAGAVAATGIASFVLTELFDRVLPQPPTPPGHPEGKPVFPSGHAFGPLAVTLASSYVLGRERLASPMITVPTALTLPLVSAATRLVEEKHWGSDVLGGMLGGVAVAGVMLAVFEMARE